MILVVLPKAVISALFFPLSVHAHRLYVQLVFEEAGC